MWPCVKKTKNLRCPYVPYVVQIGALVAIIYHLAHDLGGE